MQRHHQAIITSRARGQGVLSDIVLQAIQDRIDWDPQELVRAEQQAAAVERMAHLARIEQLEAQLAEMERERDELEDAAYRRDQREEYEAYRQSQEYIDRMAAYD